VAKQRSIDTQSKDKAGDLGFNAKGATVKQFETAEYALAAQGDCKGKTSGSCASPISQPVKTQYGYHVLQVVGRAAAQARQRPAGQARAGRQGPPPAGHPALVRAAAQAGRGHRQPALRPLGRRDGKVVDRETAPGAATTTTAGLGARPPPT
jgi:hypothetical protein